jgi:DNA-binding transcriptional MerR regulator
VVLVLTRTTKRRNMEAQQLGYVGLEEAARRLGVGYWRVRHAHRAGHVPEPPRIGNRRAYDEEMLERLRAYFAAKDSKGLRSGEAADDLTEPGKDAQP